jgi:Nif-specific regulatory protein
LTAHTAPEYAASIVRRVLAQAEPYARALEAGGSMERNWMVEIGALVLGRQVDLDEMLRLIVDEVTRRLAADRGTLYLVDHSRGELVSRVAHLPPEVTEIRLRLGEGIAGWVARRGQLLNVRRSATDPRFTRRIDELTGYRTETLLTVPVVAHDGTVMGVLQLLNKRGGDFSSEDERLLTGLAEQVAGLLEATSLRSHLRPGQQQPLFFRFNHIVGESAAMQEVYARTRRAAGADATVLVRGESGTGKELIARAIHCNSPRREAPFVRVDCAALPENLIENELFGHEAGAFTGAERAAEGKLHAAEGGTLFLDEVGELPPPVQGKLLGLLQEKTFYRVGGTRPQRADVRFVCATHRDLEQEVAKGRFRLDLYYRLRVVEIAVPPLRERGHGDIDRLVDHFLFELGRRHGQPGIRLSAAARAALHAHSWPGNVRELENCLESAIVLAPGPEIGPERLRLGPGARLAAAAAASDGAFVTELRPLKDVERAYIEHVLRNRSGNRSAAARVLGIGRNTLNRKLEQ